MSTAPELADIAREADELGGCPYLVTVGADGRPHVVSVEAGWAEGAIVVTAGSTSRANGAARPAVTLAWPAPVGGAYSLLVDGTATAHGDGGLRVEPTGAVLHRVAGAPGEGPSCIRLGAPGGRG